jgi:uncharacterized Zn-finger protein
MAPPGLRREQLGDIFNRNLAAPVTVRRKNQKTKAETMSRKCEVCNKVFSTKGNLVRHKRTHIGDKPYQCDVCNKSFSKSGTLTIHKRTHTGDKPYQCDVCNKSFSKSGTLTIHKRTHTGDKPYQCVVCNKSFSKSSTLPFIREHTLETNLINAMFAINDFQSQTI